jgi:hypothetical protein
VKGVIPDLSTWDYEQLEKSILANGVRQAIVRNEYGVIIDGETRYEITQRHGLPCPEREVSGLTPPEMRDLCIILNVHRRHLTPEQKRAIWDQNRGDIKHLLEEQPTRSDRSIGEQIGVDHKTVASVREDLESGGEIPTVPYKPGGLGGGGVRDEREPKALNNADHKGEMVFDLTIHYPCQSDEIRKRGVRPYPEESDRLDWPFLDQILITDAPETLAEQDEMVDEIADRLKRELRHNPMKTVWRKVFA